MLSTADSSRIIVTRFVGEKDSIEKITLSIYEADDFALEKDDLILVCRKAEYRPIRRVTISGEVNFPGIYSIQENKTRLVDIIEQAGGLTEQAFLSGSRIVRKNFSDAANSEQNRLLHSLGRFPITPVENNFMKFRANGETQMSIDFSKLKLTDSSIRDIILRENDEIYIEKNDWTINVMGAVVRPGLVDFSEGKDLSYYIEKTGGYQKDAVKRKIRVIKAGSEVWLKPSQVENIEQGDAIWVPEKDFVERQERQQDVAIRGGIIGIIGSVATVITAALTVISFTEGR
jgi:protein involved in polysaccharide export with SLBB domain